MRILPAGPGPLRPLLFAVFAAAGTIVIAASPSTAAWPHDANNLAVVSGSYFHENPVMVSDGAGGAIVTWQENHGGAALKDIAAQHILASGIVDPAWPVLGRAICSAANQQQDPRLVADGSGGAIIVWEDLRSGTSFDLYAQHVLASGIVDPAWPVNGRAIAVAADDQFTPVIATDGLGGAVIAWRDHRSGFDDDVFAQRVNSAGNVVYLANGVNLTPGQPGNQNSPSICPQLNGGAIVAWTDARAAGTNFNDIYAQKIDNSGNVFFASGGKAVCNDVQEQEAPCVIQDQLGGFLFTWMDKRGGANFDIYAMRWTYYGDPQVSANGVVVCNAAGDQTIPLMVADGQGGAIVAWLDARAGAPNMYAQHLLYTGFVDPANPVNGRAIAPSTGAQQNLALSPDGTGGAIAAWTDYRNPFGWADIYAGHVLVSGAIDPVWPAAGRAVSIAENNQYFPTLCTDGGAGVIIAWSDSRFAANALDVFAQRVERFGYLGSPEPAIASVRDVPADQGGRVKVSWDASWLDTSSDPNLNWYEVYRSVPPFAAAKRISAGARVISSPLDRPVDSSRSLLTTVTQTSTYYWEYLATINAQHFLPGYSYLASSSGDSTGAANPKTLFMVVARNVAGSYYWLSAPDSGYSVDNLPPFTPAPFAGQYAGGATHLHWNPNTEADLAGYRLYRGATAGFVPGPGSLVASPADTGFADVGSAGSFYKLSAIDAHGNESGFATLTPSGTLDAGDGARLSFALAGARPNPARGSRTSVEFTLATTTPARLELLDVTGRRIAVRDVGGLGAGRHTVELAAGRRVSPGLYLVRLSQGGEQRTMRVTFLE